MSASLDSGIQGSTQRRSECEDNDRSRAKSDNVLSRHGQGRTKKALLTVLLAIEILDAVARFLVLAESSLVLRGIELRGVIPLGDLSLELVHYGQQAQSARVRPSASRRRAVAYLRRPRPRSRRERVRR